MRTNAVKLRCYRGRATAAPLIAGCLLLAGCGGSSHSSSSTTAGSTSTRPTIAKARGPSDLSANLIGRMAKNQPRLKNVKMQCPPGRVAAFPVHCRFTATDSGEKIPHSVAVKNPRAARALERPHPVAGTVTVLGVDRKAMTYSYELTYGPTR